MTPGQLAAIRESAELDSAEDIMKCVGRAGIIALLDYIEVLQSSHHPPVEADPATPLRYFRPVDGFTDGTQHIRVEADGRAFLVWADGSETVAPYTREDCLEIVRRGVWEEVQRGMWEEFQGAEDAASEAPELLHPVNQVWFRAGLIACREYMARFVEGDSPVIAMSIRANWWPSLGHDYGPPRKLAFDEVTAGEYGSADFRCKTANEVTPTQEALPIALAFLEQGTPGVSASTPTYSREEFERDRFGETGDQYRQPRVEAEDAAPRPIAEWTCFHCGETFTTYGSARDHFGAAEGRDPGCLIDRIAVEEGGKPERGRGLLMALRKAEDRIAELVREVDSVENDARLWHESEGERRRLQKGQDTSWFMFLDSLEGERLVLAEQIATLTAERDALTTAIAGAAVGKLDTNGLIALATAHREDSEHVDGYEARLAHLEVERDTWKALCRSFMKGGQVIDNIHLALAPQANDLKAELNLANAIQPVATCSTCGTAMTQLDFWRCPVDPRHGDRLWPD